MDKTTLMDKMNKLKGYEKSWRFEKMRFWVCKLSKCHPPKSLIKYLNEK